MLDATLDYGAGRKQRTKAGNDFFSVACTKGFWSIALCAVADPTNCTDNITNLTSDSVQIALREEGLFNVHLTYEHPFYRYTVNTGVEVRCRHEKSLQWLVLGGNRAFDHEPAHAQRRVYEERQFNGAERQHLSCVSVARY